MDMMSAMDAGFYFAEGENTPAPEVSKHWLTSDAAVPQREGWSRAGRI